MDQRASSRGDPGFEPPEVADTAGSSATEDEADTGFAAAPTAADTEPHTETDTAVATEAVEVPPVALAVPGPVGPRRVGGRASLVAGLIGVLAIGGAGAFGYSLNQDLNTTRTTLETTRTDLAAVTADLGTASGSLGSTTTALEAARTDHAALDAKIADLSTEVADQTACVKLQTDALAELGRIERLQTDNFNRTTEGTAWAKADIARGKAIDAALDDYYQAYSKAFSGATATARSWAAKGKDAEAKMAAQEKIQAAEQKVVDANAATIAAALDALEQRLSSAESACAEVAP
ncbi:MAG TPA: hypothetical protein VFO73_04450 [Candidatus Limnocylindrales bacterium]|nr:hypothetical protein [Candidatus Limnocylindrales bacterium]